MSKIVTITINPSIDKSTSIDSMKPEKKLRCASPKFDPGGGGINVSRAIRKLGGDSTAIYPAGGHTGMFLNTLLEKEGVKTQPVKVAGFTRENLIVVDESDNHQYRFGMPGPELFESEWEECLQLLIAEEEAEYIVASGSLPPGVPADIFGQIARIAKEKNAKLVIDTSGEALQNAIEEGVFLFKPNLSELSSIAGREVKEHEVEDLAKKLVNDGKSEIVVVSLGPKGAMLVTKDECYHAVPPDVEQKSTVGAGDSMVGGLVLSISEGKNLKDALYFAVACGTAATMNAGTELCKIDDVKSLMNKIKKAEALEKEE